jgi:(p)ppGpp synthase/HD superfamily hydrolase
MRRGRGNERKRHQSRAALLHDVIENSEVPKELIGEMFGNDVASIVVEVTDYKGLPKRPQKAQAGRNRRNKEPES